MTHFSVLALFVSLLSLLYQNLSAFNLIPTREGGRRGDSAPSPLVLVFLLFFLTVSFNFAEISWLFLKFIWNWYSGEKLLVLQGFMVLGQICRQVVGLKFGTILNVLKIHMYYILLDCKIYIENHLFFDQINIFVYTTYKKQH